jgi:hypothetical protein
VADWLAPPGWQAIFAGVLGFLTGAGVAVAYRQLRHIARPAQLEGLRLLYSYFDDAEKRDLRRIIHARIPQEGGPDPSALDWPTWDAVERTATSLDVVGLMLAKDLIDEDLVMERYMEVIIPLWRKVRPYVEYRRTQKGGGWRYFEELYARAERFRLKHYPMREFTSFVPPQESLTPPRKEGGAGQPSD